MAKHSLLARWLLCTVAVFAGGAAFADTALEDRTLKIAGGSELTIKQQGPAFAAGEPEISAWATRSAAIVQHYYGYFPVQRGTLMLKSTQGTKVQSGHTVAWPAPTISLMVGQAVTPEALLHDWVLVHEMVHLALPDVGEDHNWLAEGVATYVEGVARVQSGNMTDQELWREYVAEMPKGLPAAGDGGLDDTHSWGRTYWGGALFCLLADVKIREATHGRAGLQDALQAIGRGGGMKVSEPIERVLQTGDAATGTTVLRDLYATMAHAPTSPDLQMLWHRLGIKVAGESVVFDEAAPSASVRRQITESVGR